MRFVPNTQELSDEDLISSLKRGPIYEDKIVEKIEAEDEQWEKCVGTFVNNDCHKGKLIDTRDLTLICSKGNVRLENSFTAVMMAVTPSPFTNFEKQRCDLYTLTQ